MRAQELGRLLDAPEERVRRSKGGGVGKTGEAMAERMAGGLGLRAGRPGKNAGWQGEGGGREAGQGGAR